jgi:hypothetical protein
LDIWLFRKSLEEGSKRGAGSKCTSFHIQLIAGEHFFLYILSVNSVTEELFGKFDLRKLNLCPWFPKRKNRLL